MVSINTPVVVTSVDEKITGFWAVTPCLVMFLKEPHGATSQKTAFYIVPP
jgi:hypothetical protein